MLSHKGLWSLRLIRPNTEKNYKIFFLLFLLLKIEIFSLTYYILIMVSAPSTPPIPPTSPPILIHSISVSHQKTSRLLGDDTK